MRTVPSSQPSASDEDDGFAAMDHIEPPCDVIVLYRWHKIVSIVICSRNGKVYIP